MDKENKQTLISKIAHLESKLDMTESELVYVNKLLLDVGFPDGIEGLKHALEEVLRFEDHLHE